MVGVVLASAEVGGCFVMGVTYDSDTSHQFMDHVLVGVTAKVKQAKEKAIPFFHVPLCRRRPGWIPI